LSLRRAAILLVGLVEGCGLPYAECSLTCDPSRPGDCFVGACGPDGFCHPNPGTMKMCSGGFGAGSYNYVFVTSRTYLPGQDIRSAADADARCQALANAPGSTVGGGRHYKAWISEGTTPAIDRLLQPGQRSRARGFIRPDGRAFGDDLDSLAGDGAIFHAPQLDEAGRLVPTLEDGHVYVATGTLYDGRVAPAADWQGGHYEYGNAEATSFSWTAVDSNDNVKPLTPDVHLYCFGVDLATPLVRTKGSEPARKAFVTHAKFDPALGVTAADDLCRSERPPGEEKNDYLALLSQVPQPGTSGAAADRFDLSGPTWERFDGIPLLRKASDLRSAAVLTPLNVDSLGVYLSSDEVWTGSESPGEAAAPVVSCHNWTTHCSDCANYDVAGKIGFANSTRRFFNGLTVRQCYSNPVARLYCLQR
jgi:hypothetical protein